MNDDRKTSFWPWMVALLIALPFLYVLSSGPARCVLMSQREIISDNGHHIFRSVIVNPGDWNAVYAPLDWAARQKLGAPLQWYWRFFSIPEEQSP